MAASAPAKVLVDAKEEVRQAIVDLGSETLRTRYWATVILGRYPPYSDDSVPVLRHALEDSDWPVRLGAARALEDVGPRAPDMATVAALARRLHDRSTEVRAAASFALAEIGMPLDDMLPALEAGSNSATARLRVASTTALVRLFPESAESAGPAFSRAGVAREAALMLRQTVAGESPADLDEQWVEAPGVRASRLGAAVAILDADVAYSEIPFLVDRYENGLSPAFHAVRSMAPYLAAWHPGLLRSMAGGDLETRRRAALTVGMLRIADPAFLSGLEDLLRQDETLAVAAAKAFGMLGTSASAKTAVLGSLLLNSSERPVQEALGMALISIDLRAAEGAASEMRAVDPEFSEWLSRMLVLSQL